ncbi:MAG: hypothetical protein ACRET4_13480 [Steroidobacteraceae bacterium]
MKDSQAQEDIWHLTLDDLWAAPPAEPPRLGGDGPFVINLTTSPAPISVPPKDELHIENISVYVISRNEDGRERFRLRLGPISTELEADAILSAVRERYPGALTATATDEDLRAIGHATRNTKGAKPSATTRTPPPAARPTPRQPVETSGAKPAAKPVDPKAAALPTEPGPAAKVATRPPNPKAEAKVTTRPPTPKAEAKPAAQPADAFIVMLPPAPVIEQHDDTDEPTGTGWEIDSLLPHLTGPAPQPKAKPPAPKAAPVARKVAPPAKPKAPAVAKPAAPAPAPQRPAAAAPPAPTAPAPAHVAPGTKPSVPKPPVLTAGIETPKRVVPPPTPPAAKKVASPVVEPVAPPPSPVAIAPPPMLEVAPPSVVKTVLPAVAEVAAPPVVEVAPALAAEPAPPSIAVERTPAPAKARATPAAVSLPLLTVRNPRVEVRRSEAVKAQPPKPVVADKPAAIATPIVEKAKPPLPEILTADPPSRDPLETDWASILSAPVEDTQSRRALRAPERVEPPPAPVAKASDDSGLQRLVERSNALVKQMDTQADAVSAEPPIVAATPISPPEPQQPAKAPLAVEPALGVPTHAPISATSDASALAAEPAPPAVIFSPLNTQSIEQKLAKLAEILHGGGDTGATAPPTATPAAAAAPPAPVPPPVVVAAAPSEPAPAPIAATSDFDVEISFDDDVVDARESASRPATKPWFEVDRRQESRPRLKSPDEVVRAIDELVEVDVANNLADVVARQKEAQIDPTAETDRRPALVIAEESKPLEPAPPILNEALIVEKPAPVPRLAFAADPALAPRATLALDVSVSVPKLPELEFTIDEPAPVVASAAVPKTEPEPKPAAAPPAPAVEAVNVVSTVVLDDPVPKPSAEGPHVSTVVLEPAPVVIRTRESTADNAAKSAQHVSARAAARAAKKLRLAKDAAKKAAAAAKSNGAAPAKTSAAPAVTPTAPARPAPAAELPLAPPPNRKPAAKPSAPAAKPQPVAAKPQTTAAKPQPSTPKHDYVPAKPAAPPAARQARHEPIRPASGERKVTIRSEHSSMMDSTQTIRALTPLELSSDQASRWYVIQLATSEDDFDPDQIPQLDIFDAFRLYSVIGLDGPRILHALRLGFFSDEISAQAVHGYLKGHFGDAAVKRVSIAERERFAEHQVEARKDIGATGMHAVIEMASPTPVPETRLADLQSANQRPVEEKSVWSRIVNPLKRP